MSHAFGHEVYEAPANYYVALSTADPLGDGSGLAEPSGNSYARVETDAADWEEVTAFETHNVSLLAFSAATGSWGTITHFAVFDAASGGNLLFYGALDSPVAVGNGNQPQFAAETLSMTH